MCSPAVTFDHQQLSGKLAAQMPRGVALVVCSQNRKLHAWTAGTEQTKKIGESITAECFEQDNVRLAASARLKTS